jgi:hypothetical protein
MMRGSLKCLQGAAEGFLGLARSANLSQYISWCVHWQGTFSCVTR